MSNFSKEKTLWKVNFWYQWIIQCNTDSCREHMAGGVNIYLHGCVSLLVPECAVYLYVYVCKTHSKVVLVPTFNIYRSIILSEITHQMWHVHPFNQRNQTSKKARGWRLEPTERGVGQNFKNPLPTMTHKERFWKKDALVV